MASNWVLGFIMEMSCSPGTLILPVADPGDFLGYLCRSPKVVYQLRAVH